MKKIIVFIFLVTVLMRYAGATEKPSIFLGKTWQQLGETRETLDVIGNMLRRHYYDRKAKWPQDMTKVAEFLFEFASKVKADQEKFRVLMSEEDLNFILTFLDREENAMAKGSPTFAKRMTQRSKYSTTMISNARDKKMLEMVYQYGRRANFLDVCDPGGAAMFIATRSMGTRPYYSFSSYLNSSSVDQIQAEESNVNVTDSGHNYSCHLKCKENYHINPKLIQKYQGKGPLQSNPKIYPEAFCIRNQSGDERKPREFDFTLIRQYRAVMMMTDENEYNAVIYMQMVPEMKEDDSDGANSNCPNLILDSAPTENNETLVATERVTEYNEDDIGCRMYLRDFRLSYRVAEQMKLSASFTIDGQSFNFIDTSTPAEDRDYDEYFVGCDNHLVMVDLQVGENNFQFQTDTDTDSIEPQIVTVEQKDQHDAQIIYTENLRDVVITRAQQAVLKVRFTVKPDNTAKTQSSTTSSSSPR